MMRDAMQRTLSDAADCRRAWRTGVLLFMITPFGCSHGTSISNSSRHSEMDRGASEQDAASDHLPRGASRHGGVSTYSSLPALFAGEVGSRLLLSELPSNESLVGVGSLSGLRGEIAIFDGEIWVSYPDAAGARRTNSEQAAFLAVASVNQWHTVALTRKVDWHRLPGELARHVNELGLSSEDSIAVRIEDRVEGIEFNIVNGPKLGLDQRAPAPISKEALSQTATKRSVPQARAMIAGFYARDNAQAFIHPGKTLHLHVILPDLEQMGHLDAVILPEGVTLELGRPASETKRTTARRD